MLSAGIITDTYLLLEGVNTVISLDSSTIHSGNVVVQSTSDKGSSGNLNIISGNASKILSESGYIHIKCGSIFRKAGDIIISTGISDCLTGDVEVASANKIATGIWSDQITLATCTTHNIKSGDIHPKTGYAATGAGGNISVSVGSGSDYDEGSVKILQGTK